MLDHEIARALNPEHLELILLPTERCNFRCTYCYEDFAHGKMQRSVVDAIKLLLEVRASDLESLHLSWFGGEPLIAQDIVLEINGHAARLFEAKKFTSSVTTNGSYLAPELFAKLVQSGLGHYQISLDGPRAIHDSSRKTIRGAGTFDRVWRNLLTTRDLDQPFQIVIRLHVSEQSRTAVADLARDLARDFGRDTRYSIFLKEIVRLGGPNDHLINQVSHEEFEALVAEVRAICEGGIAVACEDNSNPDPYICYASRLNSLMIRSDGRIGKCTVALNDNDNIVGQLQRDGTMTLDNQKLRLWAAGLSTRNTDQLGCPLAYKNAALATTTTLETR